MIITLIFSTVFTNATVQAAKYNVWKDIETAGQYESEGNLDSAITVWLRIIDYFEENKSKDSSTNAALFHKRAGKYYDSIKNYEKAVYHYEEEDKNWRKAGKNWGAEDMKRADQIRNVFEYYTKVIPEKQTNLAKHEPENGHYIGIYSENDKKIGQNLSKTKKVYGDHQIFLFYQDWNKRFDYDFKSDVSLDTKMAKRVKNENAALQIAMNSDEVGLDSVTENKWIIEWAKEAKELDMPIFLRFLSEMNGDWVKWHGDPEKYKEKFILIHDIMEKYAPNVAMVWCPNDEPIETNGVKIEDYYPGDEYVDWVGVNFYVDYYNSGRTDLPDNRFQNPLDHLKYVYDLYADKKPIMICETGVAHYSIPNNEDLTDWAVANLKKLYTMLPIQYPRVKAINYFSLNQNNSNYLVGNRWNNYALSENAEIEKTYKELIKSDSIVREIGGNSGFTYKKIENEKDLLNYNEIYFNFKIGDYKINKVEFYSDDKLIYTDNELPYVLNYDLSETKKLIFKIFDSTNSLYVIKEIDLSNLEEENKEVDNEVKVEEQVNEKNYKEENSNGDIEVSIPKFKVRFNNILIDNEHNMYPLLSYKNITYFPMTWDYSNALGLTTAWDNNIGLKIDVKNDNGELKQNLSVNNDLNKTYYAKIADFNIMVNGKEIKNSKEEYPILSFRDITYFPLTWRFTVDEFTWKSNWEQSTGLDITSDKK